MSCVQPLQQHTVYCCALNCFFASVKLSLVPTAGVFVTVSGFVGAKRFVGTMVPVQVDFQGGNGRPPWKSPLGAIACMVLGCSSDKAVPRRCTYLKVL